MATGEERLTGNPDSSDVEVENRRAIRVNVLYNSYQDKDTRAKMLDHKDPMLHTIFADMGLTGAEEDDLNYVRARLLKIKIVVNGIGDISEEDEKIWTAFMAAIEETVF